jgi:membrane protein
VVVGAAFAVILWVISSLGFSFYLATLANYGHTYKNLGAAVGLLFYLYISAAEVLLGAEVNAAIYHAVPARISEAELPGNLDESQRRRPQDV